MSSLTASSVYNGVLSSLYLEGVSHEHREAHDDQQAPLTSDVRKILCSQIATNRSGQQSAKYVNVRTTMLN